MSPMPPARLLKTCGDQRHDFQWRSLWGVFVQVCQRCHGHGRIEPHRPDDMEEPLPVHPLGATHYPHIVHDPLGTEGVPIGGGYSQRPLCRPTSPDYDGPLHYSAGYDRVTCEHCDRQLRATVTADGLYPWEGGRWKQERE